MEVEYSHKEKEIEFSVQQLKQVKTTIENMSKFNHIEVLRILSKHLDIEILKHNENKSGVHVNLSDLPVDVIQELLNYIKYVSMQEKDLKNGEDEQRIYKNLLTK
jgi:hypothetical protein